MAHGGAQTVGGVTRVSMPQLGESVTEGQISKWLKQPGDAVEKYEALVEVITDKVNAEVPSPVAGVLAEINVKEGETVAVGTLICTIGGGGTEGEAAASEDVPVSDAATESSVQPAPVEAPPAVVADAVPPAPNGQSRAGRASPAVRRLADEHSLDISAISGTGMGGRVTKRDVEAFVSGGGARVTAPTIPVSPPTPVVVAPAAAALPAAPTPAPARPMAGDELVPLTPMRKAIAEHMTRSRQTSPHAWCATEVDMTNVAALRATEKARFKAREGVDLSFVPFVVKATVEALKDNPAMNATWTADGVLRKRAINISVAIALEDGLIVPVIHDADMLSIAGIAHKLADLASRARAGQLKLADIEGGTFCVNNPGTFGTVLSAPIINQPQAGIMTMEAIVKRPVVLPGDLIGIRSMMFMCLSFDHRVLDGLQAGRFIGDVKKWLESVTSQTSIY